MESLCRVVFQVSWMTDFEQELTRRGVFVKPGSAAFNHFAFFKSKPRTRQMSDESSIGIFGYLMSENLSNNCEKRQKLPTYPYTKAYRSG